MKGMNIYKEEMRLNSLSDLKREARSIIDALSQSNLYMECPHCNETVKLRHTHLFYLDDFPPEAKKLYQSKLEELKERKENLREMRSKIARVSETRARAVNIGLILERIAPSMSNFPFDHNDCRSLFDPIDYVVFEGLSRKGFVERIVFAEIKTGKSQLSARQREIRLLIERKRVYWDTYKIGGEK
ncbi:MAG: hypothetical protein FGF51_07160 [Candidatus Brockarchaeota archaeon]|nr:hypothetical protein [Candidatus Brockarchaeota archaeon]